MLIFCDIVDNTIRKYIICVLWAASHVMTYCLSSHRRQFNACLHWLHAVFRSLTQTLQHRPNWLPVCFFFWRTGEPQQRWPYPQRAPNASRLGTVLSSLNGAVSLWLSPDGGCPSPTETTAITSSIQHFHSHVLSNVSVEPCRSQNKFQKQDYCLLLSYTVVLESLWTL